MDARQTVSQAEATGDYLGWKKENPSAYLTSVFAMFSEDHEKEWLVNYYNPENSAITSFSVAGKRNSEEAFKKGESIHELKLAEVKIGEPEAMERAKKELTEKHPGNIAQKTVVVLQKPESVAVWNVTFITSSFKVVNVKISAAEGEIVSSSASSVSDFVQKQPEK